MSYKYHKKGYTKTSEPSPSDRSQIPSIAPGRINQEPRQMDTLSSPYYPSLGTPDLGSNPIPSPTALDLPNQQIKNDSSASMYWDVNT